MTGVLFLEYLRWFNARITGRNVVLLVDNFTAHELGARLAEEGGGVT